MVSLAGLSATYPGYLSAESTDLQNRLRKAQATEAETQLAGQQAFGNTIKMFQSQVPGAQPMQAAAPQGPQTPMPGQPSIPAQGQAAPAPPVPGAGAPPSPQMRQPAMPQQAPPGGGGQQGMMDWRQIAQAVAQANPGAKPEVIAAAVTQFLPLMNQQAQMEWKQYALAIQQQRLGMQERQGDERIQTQRQAEERRTTQGEKRLEQGEKRIGQGEQRLDLAKEREKRLAVSAGIRQDQQYQRLELQKRNLERQVQQGDRRQGLAQWRAVVDMQHKRAMEIIQSQAALMPKGERDALIAEQNANYQRAIEEMRDKVGSSTPSGGTGGGPKINDRAPQNQPIVALPPEARSQLKEGQITTFNNGQKWTLRNGQPEQVQ